MALADGPLQVAVAGGSIGGLCAGLALQRIAGAEVDIYERHVGEVIQGSAYRNVKSVR